MARISPAIAAMAIIGTGIGSAPASAQSDFRIVERENETLAIINFVKGEPEVPQPVWSKHSSLACKDATMTSYNRKNEKGGSSPMVDATVSIDFEHAQLEFITALGSSYEEKIVSKLMTFDSRSWFQTLFVSSGRTIQISQAKGTPANSRDYTINVIQKNLGAILDLEFKCSA